jgi:Arylsulfotransferase (ASST).
MKYFSLKILVWIYIISITHGRESTYLDFQINVFDNPYPAKTFIHTMGPSPRYMAVIDTAINPIWHVNAGPRGLDFKPSQNKLSYFHKADQSWILLNEYMVETDTLTCVNGYGADYHDIQLLDDGGYVIQAYDSITVDLSNLVSGGSTNAKIIILILQEFDLNQNLIFEWNSWNHLNIEDYTNLDLTADRIEWMHGNSIEIDTDENIIVSNRRSSEIIKIDRLSGDVIW